MFETAITVLIIVGSALLFAYWFRFTCLLILSAKTTQDYARDVATANQLSFLEVQALLREAGPVDLDQLSASLERDFELVSSLVQNGGDAEFRVEDQMLQMTYSSSRFLLKTVGRFSPTVARHALDDIAQVIAHFANAAGEQATVGARA